VTAAIRSAFHDAKVDSDAVFGSRFAHSRQITVFDRNGLADIVSVEGFLQRGFELRAIAALNPEWISRDERLAEYDELTFSFPGLANF